MPVKGHPFFERVDEMLDRRRLYRKEIAPILGCTDKNISSMFARGAIPNIDRCRALAEFLQCSPSWLAWNEGHWDAITDSDTELINAVKAVPENPRHVMLELAAYLAQLPEPKKIEPLPLKSGGLPSRLTMIERCLDGLHMIQASMSPRDPLALLAESQEMDLWRQYDLLKKKESAPAPQTQEDAASGSSTAAPARGLPSKSGQLEPVH